MTLTDILKLTEEVTGINPVKITTDRCSDSEALARRVAIMLMTEEGFKSASITNALHMSPSNVKKYRVAVHYALCDDREFKKLYRRIRALVEELEGTAHHRAYWNASTQLIEWINMRRDTAA